MKKHLSILLAAGALCGALNAADKLVPLKTELPPAMLQGTQVAVKAPNLDMGEGIKELMIPEGCTNLAKDKPVTSSDPAPIIGMLEMVTDGDKSSEEGSYVELDVGKQWVQIDLGKEAEIYGIVMWHYYSQARSYHDTIIQVSNDPDFTTGVTTIFNSDHDNSSGLGIGKDKAYIDTNKGRIFDAKGVKARYVRAYSKGSTSSDANHYIEIEVWGK